MASRTVKVVLEGQVTGFQGAMRTAQKSAKDFGDQFANAGKRAGAFWNENRADIDRTATSLMVAGGAGVAALALMTKQAMSWESAWAGVTKTVDGTTEELASLQAGLREMATELPATHEEIAAVAEAAGQLGIQTPNILSFTRTMIDLGQSTNLSAEEAATGLARFSNIMGTNQADAERLGSTIVGLGNNFATTEAEILSLSMRLAGAGRQVGLSEAEVMGLATAMSSLGIDAEAGGSAMSLTMKRIAKEVELGGEKLDMFASVAGTSSAEFTTAWGDDAAGALTTFIAGLADTEHMGMSAGLVMDELGIKGLRETDALIRMSGAHEMVNEAIALGTEAYRENNALSDEAAQRYATTESQVRMATNALKDAGIEVGSHLLPILADLAGGVADLAGWFTSLPDSVQKSIIAVGGFGSVTALAVGGAMKLTGSVLDSVGALKNLANAMPRTSSALLGLSKGAGVAGLALGALFVAEQLSRAKTLDVDISIITSRLLDLADGTDTAAEALDEFFFVAEGDGLFHAEMGVKDLGDALRKISETDLGWGEKLEKNFAWLPGIDDRGLRQAGENIVKLDESLGQLVGSGNADEAAESWARISDEADAAGVSTEDLTDMFPAYTAALKDAENQTRLTADATKEADEAAAAAQAEVDALSQAFDEQAEAATAAWEALHAWVSGATSAERAHMSYEAAIDGVSDALEKNGKTLDITTEKGRANRSSLLDIVDAGMEVITTERDLGASEEDLQKIMQRTRDDLIAGAKQMGMNSDQAVEYADYLGLIPENVDTEVLLAIEKAQANKDQLMKEISIAGMSLSDWEIDADGKYAIAEADGVKYKIDRTTGEIKIEGKDKNALAKAREIVNTINNRGATIPVSASTSAAYAAVSNFRAAIRRQGAVKIPVTSSGVVDFYAYGKGGGAAGGRAGSLPPRTGLPAFGSGGRLPSTGLGTDQILGVNSMGSPTAWVDDLEWIINRKSSDKYDSLLNAVNQDHPSVQGLAGGGLASYAQDSPRSYSTAPSVAMANAGAQAFDYDKLAQAVARNQDGGARVTLNQTNINPQGVPSVVENQRFLADVAALSVIGNV